ncbi:hypothetical protein PoB_003130500 [Plakobranchus ocellatus]|uniref:Kinesin-like protein KIF26A/B helical domain-containing protein n=1 Tax=Plakobranchus ocellatus TaxID=259542 RepID=A0AAV4AD95_9GAST|nr:hypothetical protein PoB_003130500 [Plakobranchus ocellatus]
MDLSPQKGEVLERSVIGCESEADPYAGPPSTALADMEGAFKSDHFPCPDGQETVAWSEDVGPHQTNFAAGVEPEPTKREAADESMTGREELTVAEKNFVNLENNGSSNADAKSVGVLSARNLSDEKEVREMEVGGGGAAGCDSVSNAADPGDTSVQLPDSETLASVPQAEPDYPIRGTISPLSSKMAVKRSVGSVDEVSFVFGRPASPTSEDQSATQCSAPKYPSGGYSSSQCMSPSGRVVGAYGYSRKLVRPRSPSSDVLPQRRSHGMYRDSRRVLSPPPVLGVGSAAEPRIHQQGGACCEHCNGCLVELKRQALRLMFPDNGADGHLAQFGSGSGTATFVLTVGLLAQHSRELTPWIFRPESLRTTKTQSGKWS